MTTPTDALVPTRWIGLAELRPVGPGVEMFDKGAGAFANLVGLAVSQEAFVVHVEREVRRFGALLVDIEDVEPLDARLSKQSVDAEITEAADQLESDGDVAIATLDTYVLDDA